MSVFECSVCDKQYKQHRNLRRHVRLSHGKSIGRLLPSLKAEPIQWFCCSSCPKKYRNSSNLRTHRAKEHGAAVRTRTRNPLQSCSLHCGYSANDRSQLISHIETSHNIDVESINLSFPDYETFLSWKEETEYETTSKFVVSAPKYTAKQKTKYYFSCHRSGNFVSESKGVVHLKKQGSKKINGFCPASMKVTDDKSVGHCDVVFVKTHVGHANDLGHIYLTQKERESIAMKIAADVPFDEILEELRGNICSAKDRIQLVTRKDLHNIKSSFKIDKLPPQFIYSRKIRATSEVKDLLARHERSLQMSVDKVVEDGEGWLVPTDLDCREFHKVQKAADQCEGCHLTCSECNICIHAYVCTCVDNRIRRNMCKHIHLVCRCNLSQHSAKFDEPDGNNCDFNNFIDTDETSPIESDGKVSGEAASNSDGDIAPLPMSLDARKRQAIIYLEKIVSSAVTLKEIEAIEEFVDKIKPTISAVHSSVDILKPVTGEVSGEILQL